MAEDQRKIRVLVGKPGLDGHDRGVKVVARALRDAGMEVVYTGLHQTPEQIVQAALQEDVEIVAVSILSGAHMTLIPKIRSLLDRQDAADIILIAGGIIPEQDGVKLKETGAASEIFTPGTPLTEIVNWIENKMAEDHRQSNKLRSRQRISSG
jgi:methylmalonyl-CoA mutase C-terminal domain/subunit